MINKKDEIILDPDLKQLQVNLQKAIMNNDHSGCLHQHLFFFQDSKANFTLVFDGVDKNLISCETSGIYTKNKFAEVINTCKEASLKIFQFYLRVIKKSMTI